MRWLDSVTPRVGIAVGLVVVAASWTFAPRIRARLASASVTKKNVGEPVTASSFVAEPVAGLQVGCLVAGRMPGHRSATSGGTIAIAPDEAIAAVADRDGNQVVILTLAGGQVAPLRRFDVALGPAQVVVGSDGRIFVTERGAHSVAVFDSRDGRRLCRLNVAPDPVGIALSPDERTVYVTSGLSHTLTAIDSATFMEMYTADTSREPRGVVVAPDGSHAYIAHVAGEPLTAFDLASAHPVETRLPAIPIPAETHSGFADLGLRMAVERSIGDGPLTLHSPTGSPGRQAVTPLPSQAWSVAIDPENGKVLVPFMVNRTGREVPPEVRVDAYGAGSVDQHSGTNDKVSFAMATWDPAANRWAEVVVPNHARGGLGDGVVRGVRIPTAAAMRASDHALIVASTGTSSIATFATVAPVTAPPQPSVGRRGMRIAPQAPATASPIAALATETTVAQPCGIAMTSTGTTLVYSQVEHAVESRGPLGTTRVSVGEESLPEAVARGRRLFFTANDPRISSGGLSCGGCHPDGRDDGLVWFLQHGPRQTPTLAGRLIAPFSWNGTHQTIEGNIAQTVRRLGGTGLSMSEIDALAAFIQRGLDAPERPRHELTPTELRGRELFAGAGACTTCHDPLRNFTDGQPHELGGLGSDERERLFDTPSLRYVGTTAPYFHDGRYATLRALLSDPSHRMGHVEALTPTDVDAMGAYLETL